MQISLLSSLNGLQVKALIEEIQLKIDGYTFYYSIDADDLINYVYPLGIDGNRKEERSLDLEYITDEQIAFFALLNDENFYGGLFNDHIEEIILLINKIKYLQHTGTKAFDTVKELLNSFITLTTIDVEKASEDINSIKENISLLLAILVGLQSDGLQKLFKIKNDNKIDFNEEKWLPKLYGKNKELKFSDYNNELFINNLYSYLRDDNKNNITALRKNISYLRDCNAIRKVYSINSVLSHNNIKNILLYLSSDRKTPKMFYRKSKTPDSLYKYLRNEAIIINDKPINYHRNTAQLFLMLLCKDSDLNKFKENLRDVESVVKLREKREKLNSIQFMQLLQEEDKLDKLLAGKIIDLRKEYENYGTLIQLDLFKGLLEECKQMDLSDDYRNIVILLDKAMTEHNSHLKIVKWKEESDAVINELIQLNIFRGSIAYSVEALIKNHLEKESLKEPTAGDDYIFGQDHYLPNYFKSNNERFSPEFNEIVSHYNDNIEELRKFILKTVDSLFDMDHRNDELMLKRFILVLLMSNSKQFGGKIISDVIRYLLHSQAQGLFIESNVYYYLIWVLRRNKQYPEAQKKTQEALQKYKKDPRFYHALVLIKYCLYKDGKEKDVNLLSSTIEYIEEAMEFYHLDRIQTPNKSNFIDMNINALYNTKIFIYSTLYHHDKEEYLVQLKEARSDLIILKRRDKNYYNKSEFLHTEAYLELQEYFSTLNSEKLLRGLEALDRATRTTRINSKVEEEVFKLRDEITFTLHNINEKD
jgi:hypothetical protein